LFAVTSTHDSRCFLVDQGQLATLHATSLASSNPSSSPSPNQNPSPEADSTPDGGVSG
jgi:hypothetical protein